MSYCRFTEVPRMLERRPRGAPKIRKVRSEGPPEFPMQLIATRGICEHQNGCQANKAPPGAPSLNWQVRPSQPTANRLVAAKQQQPACRSLPSNAARSTAAKPSHQREATSPTRPNQSTFFYLFLGVAWDLPLLWRLASTARTINERNMFKLLRSAGNVYK